MEMFGILASWPWLLTVISQQQQMIGWQQAIITELETKVDHLETKIGRLKEEPKKVNKLKERPKIKPRKLEQTSSEKDLKE